MQNKSPSPSPKSWGRLFRFNQSEISLSWRYQDFPKAHSQVLPYGLGRSYGDSCLNQDGVLIKTDSLNHLMSFDDQSGVLVCEAGVSLADILAFCVPRGWFLPVTPGTKYVTVGGAIANDVHGKNHHCAGTFGRFVERFELLRSDNSRLICSPSENPELYAATIGGLGLTGILTWAQVQLIKASTYIDQLSIKYENLDEFFAISQKYEKEYVYSVAWVDCVATGARLGRGHLLLGNHTQDSQPVKSGGDSTAPLFSIPIEAPNFALNKLSIQAFNMLYYNKQRSRESRGVVHYNPYFYPLDKLGGWNKIYGKRGFYQYQFVVPPSEKEAVKEIFRLISKSGMASFLAVLKFFGDVPSPGMLSFPAPGITLALDFANYGERLHKLFKDLNAIVFSSGGRLYPAKDAIMTAQEFQQSYPQWQEFQKYIDPKFSSSFWRRVTKSGH